MKKLLSILVICFSLIVSLTAQNIWKPIEMEGMYLGVSADGSIFCSSGYSGLLRSQDEGETWEQVNGNYMHQCIAFSPQGRIFVFPSSYTYLQYSDDGGDTWQQTTIMSTCAMNDVAGLCAPSNDIVVAWSSNGEIYWTSDGGETWNYGNLASWTEDPWINDLIVNEAGDVYISMSAGGCLAGGIIHSTLNDGLEDWTSVAFSFTSIFQMEFDPEGNVVAGSNWDSSMPIPQESGFYLLPETNNFVIADNGIIYKCIRYTYSAVLAYSLDHGEHFTEIGENVPIVDVAPIGEPRLFKGADNHLYFDGGGEYWKSIRDADHIRGNFPLENTAWVQFYRSMYEDSTYYQLGIKGDTVVNETAYKKVINCAHLGYPIEGECFGGIREDADGKCYFMSFVPAGIYAPWPLHYFCEVNTEYPLYDFSLSVCDVFQTDGGTPNVVFDTDEMELNGSTRKVLWFDNNCDNGNYYDYQWIEGIGSTHSLLYPIQWEPDNGPEYRLVEVWQDEELLYKNPHFEEDFPYDNMRWSIYYRNLYLDWAPFIPI